MEEDPSHAFFLGSKLDLYSVLTLSSTATPAEIKSAYRRLALLHHPDKQASATPEQLEEANTKFQQIGFAYAVLKDEGRRRRYDESGRTDEGSGERARSEAEWKDYFRELWSGEVNAETLDEFQRNYQGSEEEQTDLFTAYTSSQGDLDTILSSIMCSTVDDEDRFISLINSGITSGVLTATAKWKKGSKDVKAKARRRDKASKEASEAEAYAKELGVHDKLYGDGGAKGGAKGKGKGKGKGKADDDEAGLRALIQGKQVERMDAMLESLEAKYGGPAKAKKGKKRGSTGGEEGEGEGGGRKRKKEVEPTEDEFARIQAEMDARRAKGRKSK